MSAKTVKVGLLGIGEMGAAIAGRLKAAGYEVGAVFSKRSAESLTRAQEAGIASFPDYKELAAVSEIVFSVLPPAVAEQEARRLADATRAADASFVFVEGNAISPAHVNEIAGAFTGSPVDFVDGGIVGPPPSDNGLPRLYTSGARSQLLSEMDGIAFRVIYLGYAIGSASGFKMSYASVTKGVNSLLTAAMLSAEDMGFLEAFLDEFTSSQPDLMRRARATIPRLPADAGRWVREMEEIRDTFASLDLPPGYHQGAAEIMRILDASRFGTETRRTRDRSRTLEATLKAISEDRDKR